MIKLAPETILVHRADGSVEPLAVDQLEAELAECCAATGVDDGELPVDIVRVISHYFGGGRLRAAADDGEVEALVCRVLVDAGLRELAEAFVARRGTEEAAARERLAPREAAEREVLLRADPFFVGRPIDRLVAEMESVLERLGLVTITAAAFVELAKSLCLSRASESRGEPSPYWAISVADVPAHLAPELAEWSAAGVVRWHPVSRLLPVIRCQVDLALLRVTGSVMVELALFPRLNGLAGLVAGAVRSMAAELQRRPEETELHEVRGQVIWKGLDALASGLHVGAAGLLSLRREVAGISAHHFGDLPWLRWEID